MRTSAVNIDSVSPCRDSLILPTDQSVTPATGTAFARGLALVPDENLGDRGIHESILLARQTKRRFKSIYRIFLTLHHAKHKGRVNLLQEIEHSHENASFNVGAARVTAVTLRGDLLTETGRRSEIGSHTRPLVPPFSYVVVT
jgi:hypothetical protein